MPSRTKDAMLVLLFGVVVFLATLTLRTAQPPVAVDLLAGTGGQTTAAADLGSPPVAGPVAPKRLLVATHGRSHPVVAFIGDSYVAGLGATEPGRDGYVALLSRRLQWTSTAVGLPGAGYLDAAPGPTVRDAIARSDLPKLDPDLVVLQAGHNDVTLPLGTLQARVQQAVAAVRQQLPRAQVDVVGVLWPTTPPAQAAAADAAIRAGATAAGALVTETLDLRFSSSGRGRPDNAGYQAIALRLASSFQDLGLVAHP